MTTIYDIAKKTGYSPTTVSKVFNNYADVSKKTRQKILAAAEELGYLPNFHARSLTTKRSWTIGMLYLEPSGIGLRHPFFGGVIEGFKSVAVSHGYDLMFISKDIGGKPSSYLEHCKIRGIEGVVVMLSDYMDPSFQELLDSEIPCVLLDSEASQAGKVFSDNIDGSLQAVRYLHSLGHRKIAHIAGGLITFSGQKRKEGYELAMKQLGIRLKRSYIVSGSYDFSMESGYEAMKQLLKLKDRPTAVYAAGDNLAIGAMAAAKDAGLSIPEDMSVVGFDDIEMARFITPALTTVRQDTHLLGSKAAEILIGAIENTASLHTSIQPVELIVRQSCTKL